MDVLDSGPRASGSKKAELLQVPDELGMRLGHRRVVDALMLGRCLGEADLLGKDRLPGTGCDRPRPRRPQAPGRHEHQIQPGNAGGMWFNVRPHPSPARHARLDEAVVARRASSGPRQRRPPGGCRRSRPGSGWLPWQDHRAGSRMNSVPSMTGIMTSVTTRSGDHSRAAFSPAAPSPRRSRHASRLRVRPTRNRSSGSSSTTRILAM